MLAGANMPTHVSLKVTDSESGLTLATMNDIVVNLAL
jgi:hypothetical protein